MFTYLSRNRNWIALYANLAAIIGLFVALATPLIGLITDSQTLTAQVKAAAPYIMAFSGGSALTLMIFARESIKNHPAFPIRVADLIHSCHRIIHESRSFVGSLRLLIGQRALSTRAQMKMGFRGHMANICTELSSAMTRYHGTRVSCSVKFLSSENSVVWHIRDRVSDRERQDIAIDPSILNSAIQSLMAIDPLLRRHVVKSNISSSGTPWVSGAGNQYTRLYDNILVLPIQFRFTHNTLLMRHAPDQTQKSVLLGFLTLDSLAADLDDVTTIQCASLVADHLYDLIGSVHDIECSVDQCGEPFLEIVARNWLDNTLQNDQFKGI